MSYEGSFALLCIFAFLFVGIMTRYPKDAVRLLYYGSISSTFLSIAFFVAAKQAKELGANISYSLTLLLTTIFLIVALIGYSNFFRLALRERKRDVV